MNVKILHGEDALADATNLTCASNTVHISMRHVNWKMRVQP